jgi:hypothetical protein
MKILSRRGCMNISVILVAFIFILGNLFFPVTSYAEVRLTMRKSEDQFLCRKILEISRLYENTAIFNTDTVELFLPESANRIGFSKPVWKTVTKKKIYNLLSYRDKYIISEKISKYYDVKFQISKITLNNSYLQNVIRFSEIVKDRPKGRFWKIYIPINQRISSDIDFFEIMSDVDIFIYKEVFFIFNAPKPGDTGFYISRIRYIGSSFINDTVCSYRIAY